MPNWKQVLTEIKNVPPSSSLDTVRRKYLRKIFEKTDRNLIAYYSGWLQKPGVAATSINDKDKAAFMLNIHKLDRSKGLDLILHTPGGNLAAMESVVDYLHSMFSDIRAIIPQISMSAGTMIAMSCKEIMMGKQSNLGPIDPQIGGVACQAVLDEFEKAKIEVQKTPRVTPVWQAIIGKYHPTFLNQCQQAIDWSKKLAEDWLMKGMCNGDTNRVKAILDEFADHSHQKTHQRHISKQQCENIGLEIVSMEDDNELQDLILTAHHAFSHTLANAPVVKIVENHLGVAYIETIPPKQF